MVISSVKLRRDIERTERKISELDEEMDVLEVRLLNANKGKKTALEKKNRTSRCQMGNFG